MGRMHARFLLDQTTSVLLRRRRVGLDVDPAALVGQRVKVWWDGDHDAYEGEVKAFNPDTFENEVGMGSRMQRRENRR